MLLDYHRSTVQSHEILTLLLRLRQLCCHPALIHSLLDKEDVAMNGLDEDEEINSDLLNRWQNMSINDNEDTQESTFQYRIDKKVASNLLTTKNPVFNNDRRGSKVYNYL
jgi:transcription termination factor 2